MYVSYWVDAVASHIIVHLLLDIIPIILNFYP